MMNTDIFQIRLSSSNASKLNSQHIRKTTHHGHIRFMPRTKGWFNTHKLINMIQQGYKQIIILIETENYSMIQSPSQ